MTYLRTRTNIYLMTGENEKTYLVLCKTKNTERLLSKRDVIGKSKTLYKLTDCCFYELSGVGSADITMFYSNRDKTSHIKAFQRNIESFNFIKLGILTDAGIKFVAEINKVTKEVELI